MSKSNQELIDDYLGDQTSSNQDYITRKSALNFFFGTGPRHFNYEKSILEVQYEDLANYKRHLKKLLDKNGKPITLGTKKTKWFILMSFINSIEEQYDITIRKPTERVVKWGNNHKHKDKKRQYVATIEEIKKIVDYLKNKSDRYYLIFALYISTGCRKSGLLNLDIDNIDLEKRYFKTREKNTKEELNEYFIIDALIPRLEIYINSRKQYGSEYNNLFLNPTLKPYSIRAFNIHLKKVLKRLNIESPITCNTFRHSINQHRKIIRNTMKEDREFLLNQSIHDVNPTYYLELSLQEKYKIFKESNPYQNIDF